jgi:hypothetical protein
MVEMELSRQIQADIEVQMLRAFVLPSKRERYVSLATTTHRRSQLVGELYHFRHFDPRWIHEITKHQITPASLVRDLRRLGAGESCYVMSSDREWDGVAVPLDLALESICGRVEGTLVSCTPTVLAYYEGEGPHNRFILHRR